MWFHPDWRFLALRTEISRQIPYSSLGAKEILGGPYDQSLPKKQQKFTAAS
jgi:hypothetical protein